MNRVFKVLQTCGREIFIFQKRPGHVFQPFSGCFYTTEIKVNEIAKNSKAKEQSSIIEENTTNVFSEHHDTFPRENQTENFTTKSLLKSRSLKSDTKIFKKLRLNPIEADIQILRILSHEGNRNLEILKRISNNICVSLLNIQQCCDVLKYFTNLSYKDEVTINSIASNILNAKKDFIFRQYCPQILRCIGILKYRNLELIEVILKNIFEFETEKQTKDFLTCLLTLAFVNVDTPYKKVLLEQLSKKNVEEFIRTSLYLNFVWASVLLNEYSVNHISKILSPEFLDPMLMISSKQGSSEITFLKLQNINAAAKLLIPSYEGPFLGKSFSRPQISKAKSQLLTVTLDALYHFFPKDGYLKSVKDSKYGFLIDIEFCVDSKGNPLQKKKEHSKNVAIMLLSYNDFCLGSEVMTGINTFNLKILEASGYSVIPISYKEISPLQSVGNKIEILKSKIKSIVN